ncbi:MAG: UDP-N-acetylmuramoyl-L-alanyl-D-glutamate--2,6-diaminopimelate ligase [Deltaproteobacteria bacterium]|nr:UDP-N-acetylmuramoyl-L-alanyl-D-glutamate--2,6-diaminopimelate ligase [Deltaproteobacteria bacterium]
MNAAPSLTELAAAGFGRVVGEGSVRPTSVNHDSRHVAAGALFVAIPGDNIDGARFAEAAVEAGAVAVLAERELGVPVPQLIAANARRALGPVAEQIYGAPTSDLAVVGITGTNGKTTTAWLIEEVIEAASGRPAIIGTVQARGPGIDRPAAFTTPEGDDLSRFARTVLDAGATHLVMEVSSHGLALHRVDGVRFRVAAFTNLTQDHLDFHGTFEAYGNEKARLFSELGPETAVINVDDPFGDRLAESLEGPLRCSVAGRADADFAVLSYTWGRGGLVARVRTPVAEFELESPLLGEHNLENLLITLGVAHALGIDLEAAVSALRTATGAPGRLERVTDPRDVAVLVDYAHTPDALANALRALVSVTPGRLLVVFGCGGDRDREKRPLMGRAAADGADLAIVTSDNPRTEDPDAIVDEILPGVRAVYGEPLAEEALGAATEGYLAITDRARAIEVAIMAARPGDTLLIAGKGHEDYQIVGTEKRHFDDREQAARAIARAVADAAELDAGGQT